jgi:hypothetical protein
VAALLEQERPETERQQQQMQQGALAPLQPTLEELREAIGSGPKAPFARLNGRTLRSKMSSMRRIRPFS